MAEVKVNGRVYPLRFDLDAMEQIEEEFGGTKQMLEEIRGGAGAKAVKKVFAILANCHRDYMGMPMDVNESALSHAPMRVIKEIGDAIRQAMEEGMKAETAIGGEADDEKHDVYLDEIDREEKKA